MIYLKLILEVLGIWSLIAFSLLGLSCSLRWLADRRARANVGPVRPRKGYDWPSDGVVDDTMGGHLTPTMPREWPLTRSRSVEPSGRRRVVERIEERASGGDAA